MKYLLILFFTLDLFARTHSSRHISLRSIFYSFILIAIYIIFKVLIVLFQKNETTKKPEDTINIVSEKKNSFEFIRDK
jgi:hypothetical protein